MKRKNIFFLPLHGTSLGKIPANNALLAANVNLKSWSASCVRQIYCFDLPSGAQLSYFTCFVAATALEFAEKIFPCDCRPDWATSRAMLTDPSFMGKLLEFVPDSITNAQLRKLTKYTTHPDFTPENVKKVSTVRFASVLKSKLKCA